MSFLFNTKPPITEPTSVVPEFIPEFQPQQFVFIPQHAPTPLNPDYFPTKETTEQLRDLFNADYILDTPFITPGGPVKSDAIEPYLVWYDGFKIEAGFLASIYRRNPEHDFPGLAFKLCEALIETERVRAGK